MKRKFLKSAALGALLLAAVPIAHATGTDAGTTVSNIAIVNYQINNVAQNPIGSSPTGNTTGPGVATTFVVDRELSHTVAGGNATFTVTASPGQQDAVMQFTVTNTGNDTQDYLLTVRNRTGTSANYVGTDNFDPTGIQAFVESGANVGYQAAEDTAVFIDELAEGASRIVYVIADIPLNQVNGDIAALSLIAQVATGLTPGTQGAPITNDTNGDVSPAGTYSNGTLAVGAGTVTNTADDPTVVQNVFRDAAGDIDSAGNAGGLRNGQASDTERFLIQSARLTVTKTSAVISDPANGTTNPKAIPGATVRYTVTATNSGTTNATSVVISDQIPANTTYVPGSIRLNGTAQTDANDGTDASNFNVTSVNTVTVGAGTLGTSGAAATATITFDVVIN